MTIVGRHLSLMAASFLHVTKSVCRHLHAARSWNQSRLLSSSMVIDGPKLDIGLLNTDAHIQKVKRGDITGLPIVHHHGYVSDLQPNHRFAMKKFHGVMKYLRRDNIISMKQVIEPNEINVEATQLVHTPGYVHKFFNGRTSEKEQRRTGFKWNEGLSRRCRLEAGGTVLACELAVERGMACSTAGGTHHAFPDYGSGFCLINDLAIAAKYCTSQGLAQKVLIVDLDVHQGDGTAFTFKDDDNIFTFSMHCENNFPYAKQQSDIDIGLDIGLDDVGYMNLLKTHLPLILGSFRPDLVLYDAGVDPHHLDELGRLNLTDRGLYERDYYVLEQVMCQGVPCVTVIGGGYSRDINQLSIRHTIVHRAATKLWSERGL